jgi:nucleotide-binding universal stress UspA family protein
MFVTAFNVILLAVDQSGPSDRAVEAARDLALLSGGTVHLLHMREIEVIVGKSGGSFELETDADVEALVAKETAVLRSSNIKMTVDVRRVHKADVASAIVDLADRIDADIIVMGSRGESPFTALMLGSTTYKVLHATRRPVLITP